MKMCRRMEVEEWLFIGVDRRGKVHTHELVESAFVGYGVGEAFLLRNHCLCAFFLLKKLA